MKIKEDFNLENLTDYGFLHVNKAGYSDEDYVIPEFEYVFEIGHSRRGQFYYLLIRNDRQVFIYASEPDGSGGTTILPSVLIKMSMDGILETKD